MLTAITLFFGLFVFILLAIVCISRKNYKELYEEEIELRLSKEKHINKLICKYTKSELDNCQLENKIQQLLKHKKKLEKDNKRYRNRFNTIHQACKPGSN